MAGEIRLDDQVAIITGAGKGLGRAYALELARRGARVVVNDVDAPAADAVVEEIRNHQGTAVVCTVSVGTQEGAGAIAAAALDAFGDIDIVINNAGVFPLGAFEDLDRAAISDATDVHLLGSFWLTQHAWPVMRRKGYGRIVMTSSSAGLFGSPGLANYAAVKAGLYGLGRALAFEGEEHGIKVNIILPAARTTTEETLADLGDQFAALDEALQGRRQPELVAPLVAYLASRDCAVTGEAFSCLAGRCARVFVGIADGWLPATPEELSAEAVRDHLAEIRDVAPFTVAGGVFDEITAIAARLASLDGPVTEQTIKERDG